VSGWAKLIVALGASFSTVSIFADNRTASVVFALATAIISAVNAAYSPENTAKAHRLATNQYNKVRRPLNELAWNIPTHPGAHVTDSEMKALWQVFSSSKDLYDKVHASAPTVSRSLPDQGEVWQRALPRSRWGLWRYERALRIQEAGRRLQRDAYARFYDEEAR
jgi:hypothetical protein